MAEKSDGSAEMVIASRQRSVTGLSGRAVPIVAGGIPYQDIMTWEH